MSRKRALLFAATLLIAAPLPAQQGGSAPRLGSGRPARVRGPSDDLLFVWAQTLAGSDDAAAERAAVSLEKVGARSLKHVRPLLASHDPAVRERAQRVIDAITNPDAAGASAPAPAAPTPAPGPTPPAAGTSAPAGAPSTSAPAPATRTTEPTGPGSSAPTAPAAAPSPATSPTPDTPASDSGKPAVQPAGTSVPPVTAPVRAMPRTSPPVPAGSARSAASAPDAAPESATPSLTGPTRLASVPGAGARAGSGGAEISTTVADASADAAADSVVRAIERLGTAPAVVVPAIAELLPQYPPNVAGEPVRRRLLVMLRAAGPAAAPALPQLLAGLRHDDTLTTSVRNERAENWELTFDVLAAIGPQARNAMPFMIRGLDQNAGWSPTDRAAAFREATAAKALAAMGPDGAAALVAAARDRNGVRRRNAAYGLSYVRTSSAVSTLTAIVQDTTHLGVLADARTAGARSGPVYDQAWQLEAARVAAIDALGMLGAIATTALPTLDAVARHPSPPLGYQSGAVTATSAAADAARKIRGGATRYSTNE